MKKVLVMGITGSFGGRVTEALQQQGWTIRAMLRDPLKLPTRFAGVEVVQGDAVDIASVRAAAEGVDLMVYGANPPGYRWEGKSLPWLENAATVAEEKKLTLILPENIYVFDPADGPDFAENAPIRPISSRGRIRQAMEQRLQQTTERGARAIIIRAGDYIGANTSSTWIAALIKRTKRGYTLTTLSPRDLPHTWAYLPDMARAVASLAEKKDELPAFSVFHFKGYQVSFNEIAQAITHATGEAVKVKPFPWWLLRLIAPFSELFKGLVDMRYLWETEINLRDDKLRGVMEVRQTPLANALVESGLVKVPEFGFGDTASERRI